MKILYFTPFNPFDKSCGGAIRSGALRSSLLELGDVETIVVAGRDSVRSGLEFENNVRFLEVDNFYRLGMRWPLFIAMAVISRCVDWGFMRVDAIGVRLGVDLRSFDCIVVRYVWCAAKLGLWKLGNCYVDVDDSPEAQYKTAIAPSKHPIFRPFVKFFYVGWQYLICRKVNGLWVSNPDDEGLLRRYNKNVCYLPNVSQNPDADKYKIEIANNFILSVGCLGFAPNYQGVDRFITEEWPEIAIRCPNLIYKVVGRSLPEAYIDKWSKIKGVQLLGFVDDVADLYSKCAAVVSPLWAGGGTSVKTIEAVKYGCKVLATPVAVRGLTEDKLKHLRIDVITHRGEFAECLDRWLSQSDDVRLIVRKQVMSTANSINTEQEFSQRVQRLLGMN